MTAAVRVGGTWRSLRATKVRVSGTWRTVSSMWVRVGGTWIACFAALITDAFSRTTSGSLGTSDTGQPWTNLRGVWYATGSQARSDSSVASNATPVAVVEMAAVDVTVSASVTAGTGVVFWANDANDLWGAHAHSVSSTSTPCNGSAVSCSDSTNTCAPGGCGTVTSNSSCTGSPVSCSDYGNTCNPGGCGTISSSSVAQYNCYGGYTSGSCGGAGGTWNGSQCCFNELYYTRTQNTTLYTRSQATTTTVTTYAHYLRTIKIAGGVVSTVGTDVALSSAAAAIKAVTSGNGLTVTAYSDTAMTTSLGTKTETNTAAKGTKTGLMKTLSQYNQGLVADSFSSAV